MNGKSKIRITVYITVFGVLWGTAEMFLGTYLQLFNVPFRGAFMAGLGAVLLCVVRYYSGQKGSALWAGAAAALVKLLSFGAFKLGPVSGILIESLIVETVLDCLGFNLFSVFLAGLFACLEAVPHFFITNWITYGGNIFGAYKAALAKIAAIFGFAQGFYLKILFFWILVHVLIGSASGLAAISVLKKLKNERQG